jgi:error-prone DNA polymerase
LRLGLRLIGGLPREAVLRVQQVRGQQPFRSLAEFTRRTGLSQAVIKRLSEADVFGSLRLDRRHALWQSLGQQPARHQMPLLDQQSPQDDDSLADLPPMDLEQQVLADYRAAGLSLRAHPLSFYRDRLQQLGAIPFDQLGRIANNRRVTVAGVVLLRQRPSTARGITFVTLEDETGTANLVVRQQIWDRFRQVARHSSAWLARGRLECKSTVIHIVVDQLQDLSRQIQQIHLKSRDFR